MKRVISTSNTFYDGSLHLAGTVFEVSDDFKLSRSMKVHEGAALVPEPEKGPEPIALSQVAKTLRLPKDRPLA
ncbi:hypothetical protein UFOVP1077_20 [uncultured Caudovirales phage]|uniref:Uncharacterized protein n=1 Tax=uncultured Caudovirales phage TaxID=2100421 RepID=A0A6J5SC42_9CAUD|nr:hypothetical protein UFOVP1077_20 [uncultured Caudovirales phage]CAB4197362.1 hypothetical protein UFOVP1316_8 [uncultured Caudovirales phage]CAB4211365.1 hypothetical protein UFOVP1428_17 [uncultured Caudovirales phage]CAB5227293.1 hypothetical protein UFOVP1526_27 [uncultured Caudovirales phage]